MYPESGCGNRPAFNDCFERLLPLWQIPCAGEMWSSRRMRHTKRHFNERAMPLSGCSRHRIALGETQGAQGLSD